MSYSGTAGFAARGRNPNHGNGSRDDIEYIIPFEKVRSVRPDRWASAIVELKGGVVILMGADSKEYVAWKDVKRVDFERQAVRSVRGC